MRTILLFFILILPPTLNAQQTLDTLYANDKKNVALFFPGAIRQGITGASHFVFTYNREKEQYFGLLQAKPGEESNLLVVTDNGHVYSYILKYAEKLLKLNYFISKTQSIGKEIPIQPTPEPSQKEVDRTAKKMEHFKRFGEYLLASKLRTIKTKRKNGIKFQLLRVAYKASETYIVMEITNASGITFEIDFLNVYRVNGNKKRKSSFQKLKIAPLYTYKTPTKVWNSQSFRFVYVLPKFVLGDKEKLQLELQELNGNRKVILKAKL